MKKFDVLKSITDEKKFSELIFDLISECKTSEKFAELLEEEMTEDALKTLESIAGLEYPLSFDSCLRAQLNVEKVADGYAECDVRLTTDTQDDG